MDDTYNFYRIHKLIIHTFLAIILIGIYLEFWEETNKKCFFLLILLLHILQFFYFSFKSRHSGRSNKKVLICYHDFIKRCDIMSLYFRFTPVSFICKFAV